MVRIQDTDIFKLKKKLLLSTLFLRFFCSGAEYSVILPTALLYLKGLQATHIFMGFVIAAYPLSAMIALPSFGHLYDRTGRFKELVLIANSFEIVGNILYALPYSKWLPAVGRLLAGVGDGFIALCAGELTHLYSPSARIGILSLMELGRVIGLIIGPSFNFLIANKKFYVQSWILDDKTMPGVMMAIIWMIMQFISFFAIFNLGKEIQESGEPLVHEIIETDIDEVDDVLEDSEDLNENNSPSTGSRGSESSLLGNPALELRHEVKLESADLIAIRTNSTVDETSNPDTAQQQKKLSFLESVKHLGAYEIIVIFLFDLVTCLSQTVFEVLMPYMTEFDYHWSPTMTGLVYVVGGFELILVFGLIILTSGKIKDIYLLLVSAVLTQIALALMIYESILKVKESRIIIFVFVLVLVFGTIPLNLVASKSLFTKLLPIECQGVCQGMLSAISRIALISGPLIAGAAFEKRGTFGAIMSIFTFFMLLTLFSAFNKINNRMERMSYTKV